ncbi:hypothetical protein PCANC_16306 [Puccinia coronata f. sp. avenae]|uniref:Uncharacterized protein n=1 Tax=Puccinia coronata f. sp. avenae TaxID=200324 RepID=A0A2N5UH38_9BASI|nr:hypothetical protein PCANC_16306 [Puccinia coronata f. sp. avenae]
MKCTSLALEREWNTTAEKAIRLLKQTKSVAHYTHTHHTDWETSTLISQYTQGLKKDIPLALVLARVLAKELLNVSNLALRIDNEINGADNLTPAQPTADPNAMDLLAL